MIPYLDQINPREISKSLLNSFILVINDQGSLLLDISTIPHLSFTSTNLARVLHLINIRIGIESLQHLLPYSIITTWVK